MLVCIKTSRVDSIPEELDYRVCAVGIDKGRRAASEEAEGGKEGGRRMQRSGGC